MGTYVLALRLSVGQHVDIGCLGRFHFSAGYYLYAGSAQGPGGLAARLRRHRRRLGSGKKAHWHVDYLREVSTWAGAWVRISEERLECRWARGLRSLPGVCIVAPGFGSSDCRCASHLVYVPALPGDGWFAEALGAERMALESKELLDLLDILERGEEEHREQAALELGRFGGEAVDPLVEMLVEGDGDRRWWAARALAETGGEGAVPALVRVLEDADPDVRACAALALGRIGDGAAAPALAESLGDESAFVASVAGDALAMMGEAAVEALAAKLKAERAHTRLLAVRALGRIKSEKAIGPLFGVLEDSSYLVRYYAQETLDALGVGMIFFTP